MQYMNKIPLDKIKDVSIHIEGFSYLEIWTPSSVKNKSESGKLTIEHMR